MKPWEDILTENDRKILGEGGYGGEKGFGCKSALLVIDVMYKMVGLKPEPILESIKTFPTSCGDQAWKAIHRIEELLFAARSSGIPVIHTAESPVSATGFSDPWSSRKKFLPDLDPSVFRNGYEIVEEVFPQKDEPVIYKQAPSCFWGTPLLYYLIKLGVDTLIFTGGTTSGCLRASVIDSFSNGFNSIVVEEAVFDRLEISQKVSLLDIHAKYGDVVSCNAVMDHFKKMKAGDDAR